MIKIAINGFGRIGRNVLRVIQNISDLEVIAVNDLTDSKTLAHLLQYDSVHGRFDGTVVEKDGEIWVNDKKIKVYAQKDPRCLPWQELGVDIVVESTGRFTDAKMARVHLEAGAKKIITSAPAINEDITIVMGVNEKQYNPAKHHIVSNASCTTNCLAPVVKVLHEKFRIESGLMTTVHSYTNDQRILDLPHNDLRRARAAGLSIIPTTTGAARAVTLVLPELEGKLNGIAIRVPTANVSVIDLVANVGCDVTVQEVNDNLREAAETYLQGILAFNDEPLVSNDYCGDIHSSIVDGLSTMVIGGNTIKIVAWYDNEWAYSNRVVDLARYIG